MDLFKKTIEELSEAPNNKETVSSLKASLKELEAFAKKDGGKEADLPDTIKRLKAQIKKLEGTK